MEHPVTHTIPRLEKEIEKLQSDYDKNENNPGKQSLISNQIKKVSRKLDLWKKLYAAAGN